MKLHKIALPLFVLTSFAATSCQENEYGEVDLTPNEKNKNVEGVYTYSHPCAMYDKADFDRVKALLASPDCPAEVKTEFTNLSNSSRVNVNYTPQPVEIVYRGSGTPENYRRAFEDASGNSPTRPHMPTPP